MGRSCVGRRCTVPRGPNVLGRLRSVLRASRIAVRVIPASRSPMDSSAADNTWACAPHMVPTIYAGRASCNGADSACRSRRLAQTSPHDKHATSVVRLVICTPAFLENSKLSTWVLYYFDYILKGGLP